MRHSLQLAAVMALLGGCDRPGDVREWTPDDHQGEQRAAGQVSARAGGDQDDALIDVTWQQNCAPCHGIAGRGDTQQGQMLRVPDLARPELGKIDDDALAGTIKRGRNKMPSFDKLSDRVIAGLVRHVRKFGQQR